jgi:lantibiotic modifying enzyme
MTGLLPRPDWAGEAGRYVDASGLGSVAGQQAPLAVPTLIDPGKDTARIELDRPVMSGSANQPASPGAAVRLLDHAGEIVAGFTEVYELCAANREELLAGPLGAFDGDEVRVVPRHTLWYDTLLRTAFHPDVLCDGLDRERHFDALWRDVPRRPQLAALTSHERSDLWRNDIPVFTARTDEAVLYSSDRRVMPGFRLSGRRWKFVGGKRSRLLVAEWAGVWPAEFDGPSLDRAGDHEVRVPGWRGVLAVVLDAAADGFDAVG